MTIESFREELKRLDANFDIIPNPKIPALAGVYFMGTYLFGVPNYNIYDQENPGYKVELPNGDEVRHRTRPEALTMAKHQLATLKFGSKDDQDAILGTGVYSSQNLAATKEEMTPDIIIPNGSANPESLRIDG